MSIRDRLTARPDIDNDDIPWIIERADALQTTAQADLASKATVEEVVAVGQELDIGEDFIEKAIAELRRQRTVEAKPSAPTFRWAPVLLAAAGLALGIGWFAGSGDSPPPVRPPAGEPVRTSSEPPPAEPTKPDPQPEQPTGDLPAQPAAHLNPPPTAPASPSLSKSVAGDWVLVSYHMLQNDQLNEVAVSEGNPYGTRERWRLRDDGTFLHVMGELTFSGTYTVSIAQEHPVPTALTSAESFVLTTTNVTANVPGLERPIEYYAGDVRNDRLVLFYLGKHYTPERPPGQAHGFRKSWRGGWTW